MENARTLLKNFLRSKTLFYILTILFCIFLAFRCGEYDFDLYARLIVGEHLIETHEFLYKDFLSYTPTHIWYDHEWGASVIFYLFFKYFGALGFTLFQALAFLGTTFFVIKTQQLQKHAYPPSLAFIGIFLAVFAHLNPSLVRCHLFSFFFFSMFLYILEKNDKGQSKNLIWIIPPVIILWNNIHGGVVSGMGLVFMYMVGAILSRKPWVKYFLVLLISTPLLAINPYGCEYLNFLLSANTKNRKYITEWWSVFVQRHALYYYPTFSILIFTITLNIVNTIKARKIDITKLIVLIVTSALGIIHVKLLPIAVITIASLCYNDIIKLLGKTSRRYLEKAVYLIIFLVILFMLPYTYPGTVRFNPDKFPIYETEFIRLNNIRGNILTSFGFGSYVSYKLYPNNLIFMDGRYEEVYYDEEFNKLLDYELCNDSWKDVYLLYPTEILMPEKNISVYETLKTSDEWDLVYEGPVCGVFLKKENNKRSYKMPVQDIHYYQETAFNHNGKFGKQIGK